MNFLLYTYKIDYIKYNTDEERKNLLEIFLIRHGPTNENRAGILIGQSDPPLANDSRLLIKSMSLSLEPDIVYSSPSKRAYETALLLFPEKNIIIEPDILERNFGDFEGSRKDSLIKITKGKETYLFRDEDTLVYHGGESIKLLEERINRFIDKLLKKNSSKIAVVSHGTLISHFVRILTQEKNRRDSPGNLRLVHFKLDKNRKIYDLRYDVDLYDVEN
jgi:broad specificity phosphatase PhoE